MQNTGGVGRSVAFADVITIPVGNKDSNVAFDDGLATEAGVELEIGGLLDAVEFVVVHFREVFGARFDDHVAGGACAASAAGMFEVEIKIHRHIKQ